jgi:uncharacterized membrane protein
MIAMPGFRTFGSSCTGWRLTSQPILAAIPTYHHHAQMKVGVERHIAKAISYRIAGTTLTLVSSYIVTGSATIATSLTVVELCLKPVMYFLHERVWYKYIPLGLHKDRD